MERTTALAPSAMNANRTAPGAAPARVTRRDPTGSEYWRAERVARYLDVSRKRVYQLVEEKKLDAVRLGPRTLRIPRAAIERYLAGLLAADSSAEE